LSLTIGENLRVRGSARDWGVVSANPARGGGCVRVRARYHGARREVLFIGTTFGMQVSGEAARSLCA